MVPTALCQAVDLVAWHGTVVRKGLQYGLCVTVPKGRARRPPLCLQDCWRWCLTLLCGETMAFMSIEQHVAIDGMLDTERNVVLTITLAIMSAVRAPLRELCSSQDVQCCQHLRPEAPQSLSLRVQVLPGGGCMAYAGHLWANPLMVHARACRQHTCSSACTAAGGACSAAAAALTL